MAVARKSDVYATGSGFPTAVKSGRQRRSAHRQQASTQPENAPQTRQLRTPGAVRALSTSVSSRKQRHSSKNLSVSARQLATKASSAKTQTTSVPDSSKQKAPSVPVMPSAESAPSWLLRLFALHRHSSIAAFVLVATTLVVYGWTVYSQQLWSQASRKLQNLHRHERQLMTANEVLKNQMAKEAERPPAKLVSPTPAGMLFLKRAPVEPNPVPNSAPNSEIQQQTPNPVGY